LSGPVTTRLLYAARIGFPAGLFFDPGSAKPITVAALLQQMLKTGYEVNVAAFDRSTDSMLLKDLTRLNVSSLDYDSILCIGGIEDAALRTRAVSMRRLRQTLGIRSEAHPLYFSEI
jgi:hypothetical protein